MSPTQPPELEDARLVKVLRALADAKRFRMVQEIAEAGEMSCGQLGERFSLAQPTISHHLKILSEAGVLKMRREAQHGFISVDHELLEKAATLLAGRLLAPNRTPRRKARSKASASP